MKKLSLLLVLFSYNFCYAGDLSNDIINYFDTEITKSIQLKRENALIRNIVQLTTVPLTFKISSFDLDSILLC